MKTPTKKLCINTTEIAQIIGVTIRQARNIMQDIKLRLKKEKHQSVSLKEFSEYSGLALEELEKFFS
jgi:hypothetical protein